MVTQDYTGLLQRSSEPAADALMTSLAPAPGKFVCDDSSKSNRDSVGKAAWRKETINFMSAVLTHKEQTTVAVLFDGICPELHARNFG